ncbi:hypothetical protein niasHT_027718 [Heterodera trifolii]|uniref:Uncharacterized protein n=1 Tax=Heterodera trifolii TaxID=157864 RepID=A0ABD2KC94_9BILA
MVEAFGQFTAATVDLAVAMRKMSPEVGVFVKLLEKTSSLVMAGVETVINPGSDEYRSLAELHRLATVQFRDVQRAIELNQHEQRFGMHYMHYLTNVVLSIDTINLMFQDITNPSAAHRSHQARESFIRECNTGNTPREAIAYLNRVANLECAIPNKWEAAKYVQLRELFRQIESTAEEHSEYAMYKNELFEKFGQSSAYHRSRLLKKLSQNIQATNTSSPGQIIEAIANTIGNRFEIPSSSGCLLDAVADVNKWQRPIIYATVNTIRLHVIQLTVIQAACINISRNGDPIQTARLFGELNANVEGIFYKIAIWLEKKMKLAWPKVTLSNAKDAIKMDLTHDNFNSTANQTASLIMQTADLTGEIGFVHTVIITEKTYDTVDWFYAVPSCDLQVGRCALIKNYRGINVIIFRYPLGSEERIRNAQKWLNQKEMHIRWSISTWFAYGAEKLPSIFEKIQAGLPEGLISPRLFYNALFLHTRNFWAHECVIPVGISSIPIGSMEPVQFVEFYFTDPQPWFVNFRYRIYLKFIYAGRLALIRRHCETNGKMSCF